MHIISTYTSILYFPTLSPSSLLLSPSPSLPLSLLQQVLQTSLVAAENCADTATREQTKSEKKLAATRHELAESRQGLEVLALRLHATGVENRELERVVREKATHTLSLYISSQ